MNRALLKLKEIESELDMVMCCDDYYELVGKGGSDLDRMITKAHDDIMNAIEEIEDNLHE